MDANAGFLVAVEADVVETEVEDADLEVEVHIDVDVGVWVSLELAVGEGADGWVPAVTSGGGEFSWIAVIGIMSSLLGRVHLVTWVAVLWKYGRSRLAS